MGAQNLFLILSIMKVIFLRVMRGSDPYGVKICEVPSGVEEVKR